MRKFAKGDLCYTAAPFNGQRGAFVVLVAPTEDAEMYVDGTRFLRVGERSWIVDGWVRWGDGRLFGPRLVVSEECLRKVDPGRDEEDEEILRRIEQVAELAREALADAEIGGDA